jgi:hypothetical protein
MVKKKITELPDATEATADDIFPMVDDPLGAGKETQQITKAELFGPLCNLTSVTPDPDVFVVGTGVEFDTRTPAEILSILDLTKDHGSLDGLMDDDHPQYTLVDGTRAFTGVVGGIDPTAPTHLTTKDYVDTLVASGITYLKPVLDKDLATPPGGPTAGDRYIVDAVATGAWVGRETDIAEWNGATWDFTVPVSGNTVLVEDESNLYVFDGVDWVQITTTTPDHGTLGGLLDDDHTQYSLADGTRDFTGVVVGVDPVADNQLTTKGAVDALIATSARVVAQDSEDAEDSTVDPAFTEKIKLTFVATNVLYFIAFAAEVSNDSNSAIELKVELDDTTILNLFNDSTKTSEWRAVSGYAFTTLSAASHDVDMDFRRSAGGGGNAARIRRARLAAFQVG